MPKRKNLQILNSKIHLTASKDDEPRRVEGVLARGDMMNANLEYYSREVFQATVEAAQDDVAAGKLIGLLNHPDWFEGAKGSPDKIVVRWDKLWMDGADMKGSGVLVSTTAGKEIAALYDANVHLALSTNGYGSYRWVNGKNHGVENVDEMKLVDEFRLLSIDVVNDPANVHAQILKASRAEAAQERERKMEKEELQKELEAMRAAREAEKAELEALKADRDALQRENRITAGVATVGEGTNVKELVTAIVDGEVDDAIQLLASALKNAAPDHGSNGVPANDSEPVVFDALAAAKGL